MQLALEIPVKSLVYKFLLEKYGHGFRLSKRTHLGITLFNMLRRPSVDIRMEGRITDYSDRFKVHVSEHAFFKRGCRNLDANSIVQFNAMVEDLIEAEFCGTVEFLEMFGLEQKQAIEVFMAKYDLDETDVKFDALKKAYQRYWKNKEGLGKKKYKGTDFLPLLFTLQTVQAIGSRKCMEKVAKMVA